MGDGYEMSGPGYRLVPDQLLELIFLFSECIAWVNASNGALPSQAWIAWDPSTSYPTPTYIGRAGHNGGLFPGTLLPHKGVAHIAWGGQNYAKDNYQVI